jgi:hypothetical protein
MRKALLAAILVVLSSESLSWAQSTDVDLTAPLSISLGAQVQRKPLVVLDFGAVSDSAARSATVSVASVSQDRDVAMYVVGTGVSATWKSNADSSHVRRLTPQPSQLEVKLEMPIVPSFNVIVFAGAEGVIGRLLIDFVPRKESLAFEISTLPLASGAGKAFSNADGKGDYLLCSGPAPPRYTIQSHSFTLDHVERRCNSWATCNAAQVSDEDVCWAFALQGYEDRDFQGARLAHAGATLTVAYKLVESTPILK